MRHYVLPPTASLAYLEHWQAVATFRQVLSSDLLTCCRLGRQRDSGAPGFGNARDVRNLLELAISRQSSRVVQQRRQGMQAACFFSPLWHSLVADTCMPKHCSVCRRSISVCSRLWKAGRHDSAVPLQGPAHL